MGLCNLQPCLLGITYARSVRETTSRITSPVMSHPVYHRYPEYGAPRAKTLLYTVPSIKRGPGEGPNIEFVLGGANRLILKSEELVECLLY